MRPVDLIQLSRHDSIDSACEMLKQARHTAQVWMTIPWRTPFARQLLNLKRLQRTAADRAIDLRIVSRDSTTRTLARAAGLGTALFAPHGLASSDVRELASSDLAARVLPQDEAVGTRHQRPPHRFDVLRGLVALVFVGGLLGLLLVVIGFFMPTAEITLEPVATRGEVSFTARANARYRTIDETDALLPLRSVQVIVEGDAQTPVSGTADVAEGYATGAVVFTNRTNEAVVIPEGTAVQSGSGVTMRFLTTSEVTLPATIYSTVRAPVQASEAGYVMAGAYTISRVEGALASKVEVLNDASIEGGGSRRVATVAYQDLDTLRGMLVSELQTEAYSQLEGQLATGEFVPSESLHVEVMSLEYDQVVGQQADKLSGKMKLVVRGSAIDEENLRDLARSLLKAQAGGGVDVIEDSLQLEQVGTPRIVDAWVELDMRATAAMVPTVDLEALRAGIRGRTLAQATEWLAAQMSLVSPPQVVVSPEGWPRLPVLSGRLQIDLTAQP